MAGGVITGSGTISDPYLVEDGADFNNLSSLNVGTSFNKAYIKQVANIDGVNTMADFAGRTDINYDGQGFKIKCNLKSDEPYGIAPFFVRTGTFQNIHVIDSIVINTSNVNNSHVAACGIVVSNERVSSISGTFDSAVINCIVENTKLCAYRVHGISHSRTTGLVTVFYKTRCIVKNCVLKATDTITGIGNGFISYCGIIESVLESGRYLYGVGGVCDNCFISGYLKGKQINGITADSSGINNCFITGTIDYELNPEYLGGISASLFSNIPIKNCYSLLDKIIIGKFYMMGRIHHKSSTNLENNYANQDMIFEERGLDDYVIS